MHEPFSSHSSPVVRFRQRYLNYSKVLICLEHFACQFFPLSKRTTCDPSPCDGRSPSLTTMATLLPSIHYPHLGPISGLWFPGLTGQYHHCFLPRRIPARKAWPIITFCRAKSCPPHRIVNHVISRLLRLTHESIARLGIQRPAQIFPAFIPYRVKCWPGILFASKG